MAIPMRMKMPDCQRLRVAFAGTPEFAAVALQGLLNSAHEVVLVLSQPDRPAGRGRKLLASPVKKLALSAGIPVQQPLSLKSAEARAELATVQFDVMIVAAYGLILPAEVLSMPALGCLNIHGSLLPRWRGAAPIHRAILNGDQQTGICIMLMDEGLDTGAVLSSEAIAIGKNETSGQLHDRLAELGSRVLLASLTGHCNGTLEPVVQPSEGVNYAQKLSKDEAVLDFQDSALALHRRICAFNPWPVAESSLDGERVRIWNSELQSAMPETPGVLQSPAPAGTILACGDEGVDVATGDGVLRLISVQRPGGKALPATVWARDRQLVGKRFGGQP